MRFPFALAGFVAVTLLVSAPDLLAHGGGGSGGGGGWSGGGGHGGGGHGNFAGGWHGGFHGRGRNFSFRGRPFFFRGRFFGPGVGFYGYGYPWWGWDYAYYPYPYYADDSYYGGAYNSNQGPQFDTPRAVQAALAWRGYYSGRIDGVMGPETRDAIRSFQEHQGLQPTGQIDNGLINALRLQAPKQ